MGYSPLAGGKGGEDALADAVLGAASKHGCKPETVALAWVRAKGILPSIGPRGPYQLAASLAATELASSPDEVGTVYAASQPQLGHPHELLASLRAQLGLSAPWTRAVF